MTSIMLTVTGAQARASVTGPLTSGMVGIPVTIAYDKVWDGLTKNLVCRCSQWGKNSGETRTILNVEKNATVAHEVMKPNMYLYLGIEGFSDDGELVIPTVWAKCGKIQHGANTGEDPSTDPELSVWNQLQTEIEQIKRDAADWNEHAAGGMSSAAAGLLIAILRECAVYTPQTANIDALEAALSQTETPAEGVAQNGSVLTITSEVTVTQDGDTINIA